MSYSKTQNTFKRPTSFWGTGSGSKRGYMPKKRQYGFVFGEPHRIKLEEAIGETAAKPAALI